MGRRVGFCVPIGLCLWLGYGGGFVVRCYIYEAGASGHTEPDPLSHRETRATEPDPMTQPGPSLRIGGVCFTC